MDTERDGLTTREQEVVRLARLGYTNREIADRLGITRNAVRYHLKEVHSKLDTGSDRGRLAHGWKRALGLLGVPVAKLGVPATVATFAGGIALTGLAAYQAMPGEHASAGPPDWFEGTVTMDGRYPNGCPAEYNAGTMTLEDFAHGRTTLEEIQSLNPDLPLGPLPPETIVRVPYNPDQSCTEVDSAVRPNGTPAGTPAASGAPAGLAELRPTPPGSPPLNSTPPAGKGFLRAFSPANGSAVTQASTASPNPAEPSGVCAMVSFTAAAGVTGQWFRLWFDGDEVTGRATWVIPSGGNPATGRLCFAPPDGLTVGKHTAEIVAADPADGSSGRIEWVEWEFEVTP